MLTERHFLFEFSRLNRCSIATYLGRGGATMGIVNVLVYPSSSSFNLPGQKLGAKLEAATGCLTMYVPVRI